VRKVVNDDCFDPPTNVTIRVVCFDDRTTFKLAQAMIVNQTYYRATDGKIIVQDQTTIVASSETVDAEVRIPFDQYPQANKLSLLKLFVDRIEHKGPEVPLGCS